MACEIGDKDTNSYKREILDAYGELLTPTDLAKIFRYPSEEAVLKAHTRGVLPVPLARFRGRRGWFVTATIVAEKLNELESELRRKT